MILRDYQSRLVSRADEALGTFGDTLAVSPTGSGKTVMMAALADKLKPKKALILQHRDELVAQNASKFSMVNPKWSISFFDAKRKSWDGRCTFAMVQTLHRNLTNFPSLDLLIVDESHHSTAKTYKSIIDAAKDKNPGILLAGFTATPSRGDGKGMRSVFSNVCDQITMEELIEDGFLVEPKCYGLALAGLEESLKKVRRDKSGEYDMEEAAEVMNTTAYNHTVIREWKNLASDRKTIVFCTTVKHSKAIREEFEKAGFLAAHVDGTMGKSEREATLKAFDQGPVQVLCNCSVLTEGYDSQPAACVILLRPCSYKSTMLQMIGRGLRIVDPEVYPGVVKKDCLVLDFGTSLKVHGDLRAHIRMEDRELKDAAATECWKCKGRVPVRSYDCPLCGEHLRDEGDGSAPIDRVDGSLVEIELFKKSPFRWVDLFGSSKVMMASGFNAWVGVMSKDGDTWTAIAKLKGGGLKTIAVASRVQAIAKADDFLRTYEESDAAKKSKGWMRDPASDKQWAQLVRFGYKSDPLGLSMNKYNAACHMNFQFNRQAIERVVL